MIRAFRKAIGNWPRSETRLVLFLLLVFKLPVSAWAGETVLADFESGSLSETWVGIRTIRAERTLCPEANIKDAGAPAGRALKIQTSGKAGVFTRTGKPPLEWPRVKSLSFWVHRTKDEADRHKSTALEVQFYEADGKTRYWRKVDLDHVGWKQIDVNLKWCRWSSERIPDWKDVKRFGFWFQDAGEIVIDNVSAVTGSRDSAWLTDADLKAIMIPDKPESVAVFDEAPYVRILTDASKIDGSVLAKHLGQVAEKIVKDFEFLPAPSKPGYLLVFADREQYQNFPSRFAEKQNAKAEKLTFGGFTFQGMATSYWTEIYGTLRPVYAHEFAHALLGQILDLSNRGEWLHEGLAVRYQLAASPQKDFPDIVRHGVRNAKARLPLDKLLDGKPIQTQFYWQATTVVDFLSTKYAEQWPALIKAIRQNGSTDLGPHLEPVLKTNWQQLEADWIGFCQKKYAAEKE